MGNVAVRKGFKRSKKVGLAIALVSVVLLTQSPRGRPVKPFHGRGEHALCVERCNIKGVTSVCPTVS